MVKPVPDIFTPLFRLYFFDNVEEIYRTICVFYSLVYFYFPMFIKFCQFFSSKYDFLTIFNEFLPDFQCLGPFILPF